MGIFSSCCKPRSNALVFFGLCDSGKTTIVNYIEHSAYRLAHPTLGVQISTAIYQDQRVEIWDVSGRDCAYWSKYYSVAHGIIFVIDGTKLDELDSFLEYTKGALENKIVQQLPLLIYINKIWETDENNIESTLETRLELKSKGLNYKIQRCDPKIGKGVMDGYNWIMSQIPHP